MDRSRRSECSTLLRSGPMMVGRPSSPPPPRRGVLDRARSRWSGVPSAKGPGLQRSALSVALLFAFGCRDGDDGETGDDGPMVLATTGNANGSSTGDDAYVPSEEATDQCGLAPTIGAGRHEGTLRGKASELDGACGLGGPDAFLRLDVPRRSDVRLQAYGVGLVPRVGALPHTCATDWTSRTLACTQGVGTWLLDVAAGSSLVISVGADEDLPVLKQAPPMEGPDPLAFVLDVELRNVLEPGEPCEPATRGRCGTGTLCLPEPPPEDAPDAEPGPAMCVPLLADTCQTAEPWPIGPGVNRVEIDPATPQTDAHAHSCGGARRRERVLQLRLPEGGPHALEIRADRPEVGLAVRAPGCLPSDERGCVDPDPLAPDAPPVLGAVELSDPEAFLFVELPAEPDAASEHGGTTTGGDEPGEEAPITIEVELLETAPRG